MAQAVGVCTSLRARARGEPQGAGYLVGARELRLDVDAFVVGDVLTVEATLVFDGRELGAFDCSVTRSGEPVATGTLNVYRQVSEGVR
jgi:predicted hotdog family 3-hydroxylacyl-ACP dehydratase